MTTFTVWKFEDPEGAAHAATLLKNARMRTWSRRRPRGGDLAAGRRRPEIHHAHDDSKRGAAWGALWGVLGGALFTVPIIGGVVGVALVALAKSTEGTGITKDDLARIRTEIVEGTSALFVVSEEGNLDRLGERFRGTDQKLIGTNLTDAEREVLLETFGGA